MSSDKAVGQQTCPRFMCISTFYAPFSLMDSKCHSHMPGLGVLSLLKHMHCCHERYTAGLSVVTVSVTFAVVVIGIKVVIVWVFTSFSFVRDGAVGACISTCKRR